MFCERKKEEKRVFSWISHHSSLTKSQNNMFFEKASCYDMTFWFYLTNKVVC